MLKYTEQNIPLLTGIESSSLTSSSGSSVRLSDITEATSPLSVTIVYCVFGLVPNIKSISSKNFGALPAQAPDQSYLCSFCRLLTNVLASS